MYNDYYDLLCNTLSQQTILLRKRKGSIFFLLTKVEITHLRYMFIFWGQIQYSRMNTKFKKSKRVTLSDDSFCIIYERIILQRVLRV